MKDNSFESALSLRGLNAQDFLNYGVQHLAYIRPVQEGGKVLYGIFAADGKSLVMLDNHDAALAAVLHNNLEPVSVH